MAVAVIVTVAPVDLHTTMIVAMPTMIVSGPPMVVVRPTMVMVRPAVIVIRVTVRLPAVIVMRDGLLRVIVTDNAVVSGHGKRRKHHDDSGC